MALLTLSASDLWHSAAPCQQQELFTSLGASLRKCLPRATYHQRMEGCRQLCLHGLPSQGGGIDKHACYCHAVNSHECLWPFNFAEAWVRHATLRAKQLVLDAALAKGRLCLSSQLCADQWLKQWVVFPPTNKVYRFILARFRKHTFAAIKKLCNCCLNWTCCPTSCRPFLSAVLDLKKLWRAPVERLQVDQVTLQTSQHCIDQTGTGLSCTTGQVFLLSREWEQSCESNATALQSLI